MPSTRRQVADDLAENAHELLAGAEPLHVIEKLEFRIQDLQEISDDESTAAAKTEEEKQPHDRKA